MASDEQRWVVKPDDARIEIAVGRDAKLSPEVTAALRDLLQALEAQQDVQGYMSCQAVTIENCDAVFSCKGVAA